jgi:hypothetical protein
MLPTPTPENAITMQMQFQMELIKRLDLIAASLGEIAKDIAKIAKKP